MIKNLNDGEVSSIRRGYFYSILLKKLSMYNLNKFKDMDESIDKACRIYKILLLLPEIVYNHSDIMLNYVLKYGYINKSLYDSIIQYYNSSLSEDEVLEDECYYDYWQEREDTLIDIIKTICNESGLVYDIDYSMRIFVGEDINEDIFGCIKKELRSPSEKEDPNIYKDMSAEELEDEYCCSYENDSLIIGIKDFILPKYAYELLHDYSKWDSTLIMDSIFIMNGNTYLETSYNSLESIDNTFIVLLILALKKLI